MNIHPLKKWLVGAIQSGASTIELKQGPVTLQSSPVESENDEEITALLENLMTLAQEEANNNGKVGPSRFRLKAEYHDRAPTFSPTFSLRTQYEDEELEAEGNDKDAIVSQLMRHNEVLMRLSTTQSQKTIEMLSQANANLTRAFNENLDKRIELTEEKEKVLSEAHERELATETAKREEERKDQLMKKVIPLLPVAVNRFLGDRKLPEPVNPIIEQLRDITKDIPPEKLVQIQTALGPELSTRLFELFASIAESVEKEENEANNG